MLIYKNKKSMRNCHSQEEPIKTMIIKYNAVTWMNLSNVKRTSGRNSRNLNKIWTLITNNLSILAH